jgi:hypothetical protein
MLYEDVVLLSKNVLSMHTVIKINHIKRLFAVAAILAFSMLDTNVVYAGFGITPPYVRNDKLTQGSTFTQEIILVRGDPIDDLKAEVTINVPEIKDWFTIDKGNSFLLPAGAKQVPMKITVHVPQNAEYKRYRGSIRIRTLSPDPASGVSIALGAQIDVDLRVVDEIRDFEVKRVQISETEEPRTFWWLEFPGKIQFMMGIENTGNAKTAPSKVQLDIYDRRGNVVLETIYNTNDIEEVLPFETRDVYAYLPTRLPPGAYLVKYSIFRFEDEVKRSGELTLSVLPKGTLSGYSGYSFDGLSFSDKLTIIIPIAIFIFVLLFIAILIYLRKKNAKLRKVVKRKTNNHDRGITPPQHRENIITNNSPPRRMESSHGVVDLSRNKRKK